MSQNWNSVLNDYHLHKIIGKGSFGQVVKGSCKITSQIVAIKNINNIFVSSYDAIKIIREILIMKHLSFMPDNKYTVKLLDLIYPQQSES